MRKIPAIALIAVAVLIGCTKEKSAPEETTFSFVVYPGAKYLSQLTDLFKQAHKVIKPNEEPPATAVYDTDAPIDDVANYYAQSYGYDKVAADATNNLSAARPAAYFRTGDLSADTKATAEIMQKVGLHPDISKAAGTYRAAEIEAKPNRPRVTIQRPYFDPAKSQVVDRTLILMLRQ